MPREVRQRPVNARQMEWETLQARLGEALGCLEDGHFLLLTTRDEEPYYVQFAVSDSEGIRAEAVANRYLAEWRRLDAIGEDRLRRLGWRPPSDIGGRDVNWWREFRPGTDPAVPARLAVATLRKVFELPRPVALVYRAFSRDRQEILLPTLGLAHEPADRPLAARVDAAMRDYLGADQLVTDDDGDRPVRCGDTMVYVRVVADPGFVSVFSPALVGVACTPALVEAVNEFNRSVRVARAVAFDDQVVVSAQFDDHAAVAEALVATFKAVEALSQACAAELQPRFGGRTLFGPPDAGGRPPDEPACGFYL